MQRKKRVLQICHDYKGPFRIIARQYAASFSDCEVKPFSCVGRTLPASPNRSRVKWSF